MAEIKKAAVIGAGVMGAGIAAHITNAGIPCVLLDIVPKEGTNRNAIAEGAVAKLLKTDPAPFMSKRNASLITTGNIDDNLDMLKDCDWIVEAVIERLDIKQALYKKIDAHRKKGSIVSSNTSTIPLKDLTSDMPASLVPDFIITHFFNPPRYMRLLEIVGSDKTRPEAMDTLHQFGDVKLGKGVVRCKDTPGFIGNRVGTYWIQLAVVEAIKNGLTVEEADQAPAQVESLLAATSRDTVRSRSWTGKPCRMLRNEWTDAWEDPANPDPLGMPLQFMVL